MAVLTKSKQVEQTLRKSITAGHWEPGEKLPSEEQLLAELQVSRTTLRDALNTLANDNMIVRRHGIGTFVAQNIKVSQIALLSTTEGLTSKQGVFHRLLLDELNRLISELEYRPVLSVGPGTTFEEQVAYMPVFSGSNIKDVSGVITQTNLGAFEEQLAQQGVHVVNVSSAVPYGRYSVVTDYAQITDIAVNMLRERGFEDFALMYTDEAGIPGSDMEWQIYDKLNRLMQAAVGGNTDRLIPVKYTPDLELAYNEFKAWWSRADRPKAIFFYDDALCDVATQAILELGIDVPEELAIITLKNVGRSFHFPVPLTGVGVDPKRIAYCAWDMLHSLINNQSIESHVVYVPAVVSRGKSLGEVSE